MHEDSTHILIRGDRDLDDCLAMGCCKDVLVAAVGPKNLRLIICADCEQKDDHDTVFYENIVRCHVLPIPNSKAESLIEKLPL